MNWQYFKTNWFFMVMGALLMLGLVRKYPQLNPFHPSLKNGAVEKITGENTARNTGAALLGVLPADETSKKTPLPGSQATEAFLKRFAQVAVSERKKFGIPASVILACAYANSQSGQHEAAGSANNFFALECSPDWEGESAQIDGKCVRRYETAWASFRDFSIYLSSQEWFGSLKKSAGKDAVKWAEKLGKEGVANAKEMRRVMEAYRLEELDH
ncbi:MAG: glucosaminidase domain-containing protein [Saprospiraceae bacterium]|nr:glucosaminidase domain-containing protein [Saprospiraceae bacterium]